MILQVRAEEGEEKTQMMVTELKGYALLCNGKGQAAGWQGSVRTSEWA